MSSDNTELLFDQSLEDAIKQVHDLPDIDVVIAIPFYNEKDSLPEVLATVEMGLRDIHPLRAALMLCVGDPAGTEVLEAIQHTKLDFPHISFLMQPGANGRGASIRAIFEIGRLLEADVVILAADLTQIGNRGFQADWVKRLLDPVRNEYDLAVASFERHHNEDIIGSLFVSPLLETFYKYVFNDPLSGVYAISHDLLEDYAIDIKFWTDVTQGYGIDPWIITRAIVWNNKICQVKLGTKINQISLEKLNYVFKETAAAMFACIKKDELLWVNHSPVTKIPDSYGEDYVDIAQTVDYGYRNLVNSFKRGYDQYSRLFQQLLSEEMVGKLEDIIALPNVLSNPYTNFDSDTWARMVCDFLYHYWFNDNSQADDILNALTFAFDGRMAGYTSQLQALSESIRSDSPTINPSALLTATANHMKSEQRAAFFKLLLPFSQQWLTKTEEQKPPLTPSYFLEFIPGLPMILPRAINGRGGRVVWPEGVFTRLQSRYQSAFNDFISNGLHVPENSTSPVISDHLQNFMQTLEETMANLLPGDLYSQEGVEEIASAIFKLGPLPKMYTIKTKVLEEMLLKFPPLNVIIPSGFSSVRELTLNMDVRDAVSLSNLVENRKYVDRALFWILDHIKPEDMDEVEIKPLVLGSKVLEQAVGQTSISDLNKITTRITINPFSKGMGGEYPHLRFCLHIFRQIMIAKNYSSLWRNYARERKNLGEKIRNSLIGRYHTDAFSVHNIFENFHHRSMIQFFKDIASTLHEQGQEEAARALMLMTESYGLSQVLDDGTFLPCSAWTWSSFSFKGGKGIPTPLSSHVEEKWFNHDLLEEIQSELGYPLDEITHLVSQFIGEGRASENLLDVLVGLKPSDVTVVAQEMAVYPPAKPLVRDPHNPLLLPLLEHPWENKYVLNAAALRIKDRVYILYRAFGEDEVSRIGLAISDGRKILERLPEPVFSPATENEKKGCEDPRVVIIDDQIYMLYTAYDGQVAQIAAASISVEDFLERKFENWQRMGLAFKGIWDKDAILFPEKINNKYVIYHRIEPSVWVSYMDELAFPVPKEKHSIIFGPRSGRMWDALKIGSGTQPIKTEYGWLMIYHGVDRNRVYRLGVILVDYTNPERLLYRSPNAILSPEVECEIGLDGQSWVPNVVFTCGAVPAEDKAILGADDELLVYYGASDSYICLASAKVGDLIPEVIRNGIKSGVGNAKI
ncbi:MAG TPA: glycosidase [Syntrophomonadaceae bacterium]|nr:glycosidase [Syntrophomonadaceae bacterium]